MPSSNPILHNFSWKLLSLFLAALTWYTIELAFQKTEEAAKQPQVITSSSKVFPAIPLTLLTSPTNTNHFRISPDFVEVDVGGDESMLQSLQGREIQAFVDVSDAQDEKQFRRPVEIRIPRDLTVKQLTPSNASIERITRTN